MTKQEDISGSTRPLLTIAIPTYNRACCLRELLSCLLGQLAAELRVELIVSDNASPDETPEVVKEFTEHGLRIRYIRNATNIGSDANFLQCFEQARGKYVWIFGDDDVIIPGGISTVLGCLEEQEFDLVYLNSYPLEGAHQHHASRKHLCAASVFDAHNFAKRVNVFFTFISGNIINKDSAINSSQEPFSELINTNLVQLGWTYAALNGRGDKLYIEDKLIGARISDTGGYILMEVFGSKFKGITERLVKDECVRRSIINGDIQRYWPSIMHLHRKSSRNVLDAGTSYADLNLAFEGSIRYWIFVYPISVLPIRLAACWLFATRVVNRIDKALGYRLI